MQVKENYMDEKNRVYTKARCLYHIVFVSKLSKRLIFSRLKCDIERIVRELCEQKNVELIEFNSFNGRIHLLVYIPPQLPISDFMLYLNEESTKYIFQKTLNPMYLEKKSRFWGRNYFVIMVERDKNSKLIKIRD